MERTAHLAGAALGVEGGCLVPRVLVDPGDASKPWPQVVDRLNPPEQGGGHLRGGRAPGLEEAGQLCCPEAGDLGALFMGVVFGVIHGVASVPHSWPVEDACFSLPSLALSARMTLSAREREVLDLEREWWRSGSSKKAAIRERLGWSPGTYYAALRRLVASEEAFCYDPLVVQRVRRRQERERRARISGVPGPISHHRR